MPSPMSWRIAGRPGLVAGTLIIRLSRPTAPKPPRLGDRRLGVHRQIGRDLEADISVLALGCFW